MGTARSTLSCNCSCPVQGEATAPFLQRVPIWGCIGERRHQASVFHCFHRLPTADLHTWFSRGSVRSIEFTRNTHWNNMHRIWYCMKYLKSSPWWMLTSKKKPKTKTQSLGRPWIAPVPWKGCSNLWLQAPHWVQRSSSTFTQPLLWVSCFKFTQLVKQWRMRDLQQTD